MLSLPLSIMQRTYTANLITVKNNKILLVKRNLDKEEGGLWSLPGGTKEDGETLKNTLIREIHEELKVRAEKVLFFKTYKRESQSKVVIASYFMATTKGHIKLNKKELSDYKWFVFSEVPKKMAYSQNTVLEDYLLHIM